MCFTVFIITANIGATPTTNIIPVTNPPLTHADRAVAGGDSVLDPQPRADSLRRIRHFDDSAGRGRRSVAQRLSRIVRAVRHRLELVELLRKRRLSHRACAGDRISPFVPVLQKWMNRSGWGVSRRAAAVKASQ